MATQTCEALLGLQDLSSAPNHHPAYLSFGIGAPRVLGLGLYHNSSAAEAYNLPASSTADSFLCEVSPPTPSTNTMQNNSNLTYQDMFAPEYDVDNASSFNSVQYMSGITPATGHPSTSRPSSVPGYFMMYEPGMEQPAIRQSWQLSQAQAQQQAPGYSPNQQDPNRTNERLSTPGSAYSPELSRTVELRGQRLGMPVHAPSPYGIPNQSFQHHPQFSPNHPIPTSSPPEGTPQPYALRQSSVSPSPSNVSEAELRTKPQCWDHGCNGRSFSTFSNLLRHQREKAGLSTKSECPYCGAEFTRSTARNGHLERGRCKAIRRSQEP
ncbi:hypothetical protein FQN57_002673 [Myotisia sp. PD_48]|nr:hypothetical protein FQN57_002673 [Myotisia sp. PD_48]